MGTSINTVLKAGNGEYEEKRSRFISWVYPINTEDEAAKLISGLKKKYWAARHHCYAYVIDGDMKTQKFSDDGEPSGTAGLPILEIIKKKDLSNVLVVVIRYFGGILLGASGLVRAYGKAALAGILDAQIITKKECLIVNINVDYHIYGKIQNFINTNKLPVRDTRYTDRVEMELIIEEEKMEFYQKELDDITGGNADIKTIGKIFAGFDENGNFTG
jgi:uncharacterized YigZ family protein